MVLRKLIVWPLLVATDGGRVKVRGTSSEAGPVEVGDLVEVASQPVPGGTGWRWRWLVCFA